MKKLLAITLVTAFCLSCSNDDSQNQNLISKITTTAGSPGTATFKYRNGLLHNVGFYTFNRIDGTLVSITTGNSSSVYTIDWFGYDNNGRLKSHNFTDYNRTDYFYFGDELSATEYWEQVQVPMMGYVWQLKTTEDITRLDSNRIQTIITDENGQTTKRIVTYDNANNPYKNIDTAVRIFYRDALGKTIDASNDHNKVLEEVYIPATASTPSATYTYEIAYNSSNFPTKITKHHNGTVSDEKIIEYQ